MIPQIIHRTQDIYRLPILLNELQQQGIQEYELWEGITHKDFTAAKGINLAHKQIVEYAKLKQWNEVLIMEDDVRFCGKGAFQYFIDNKPTDFDIYLSGIYLGDIHDGITKFFSGLHCYIVHSRFYDTFLSVPEEKHIDTGMEGLGLFKVCYPFAAIQYNGISSQTRKHENYDQLLNGRLFYNNFNI